MFQGSAWVVSSGGTSTLVTGYHVIAGVWTGATGHNVQVRQNARSFTGTITKVDAGDDLAILTVNAPLVALKGTKTSSLVGDSVLVVDSPLGIGVAESKLAGSGVEGLSFAIPVTTVCSTVTTC